MKIRITSLALSLFLSAFCNHFARAQTFVVLHNFQPLNLNTNLGIRTNTDGAYSYNALATDGTTLYGTTSIGNSNGLGGFFRINLDNTGFTNYSSLTPQSAATIYGCNPIGGVILAGDTLYAATTAGGSNGAGSVISMRTDGSRFTTLHSFAPATNQVNIDGVESQTRLTLDGDTLYGTTFTGGSNALGVVFSIKTNGAAFSNLVTFNGTNGAAPWGKLLIANGRIYGTTYGGGANGEGVIFALDTNGQNFSLFHEFSAVGSLYRTNLDGAVPHAGLTLVGDTLYGTASQGGINGTGYGVLFSINTNGSGFNVPYYFDYTHGALPYSDLIYTNGLLYGTTTQGGTGSKPIGAIFAISPDASIVSNVFSFHFSGTGSVNVEGEGPWAGITYINGSIYGVTSGGGSGATGVIFGLVSSNSTQSPPSLNLQATVNNLILSWSAGSTLQAAPALGQPFSDLPSATSPFTVPTTNSQQFFRLKAD